MKMILQNGIELYPSTRGLTLLKYYIPSVDVEHNLSFVEGRSGPIISNTEFKGRVITANFMYKAYDYFDFKLFIGELNALFTRKEYFYIVFAAEPNKRWKVRIAESYRPNELLRKFGNVEIRFICENVFAESIADTSTIKEWDSDKFAWDNTIDWDGELQYTFNTNNCAVKNLGNVAVDPREHELEIIVKGSFPGLLKITNQTTGEIYQYNHSLSSNDELKIIGIRTFRNGTSDFKNTNKKLLTLAVGDNQFIVEGGTLTSIAFNFRFLYM